MSIDKSKMKEQFLLYLLYIALVDIRERSYEGNDNASYWLSNLMHNVPLVLNKGEKLIEDAYEKVRERIDHDNMQGWLENRMKEFYERYPEYRE